MDEFTPFERSAFAGGLEFRWLTANTYEIRLPNGKTILIDPFLVPESETEELYRKYICGYTAGSLERVDYVLITHPHFDHIYSVAEVFEKFNPWILCHSSYAIRMTKDLMIPQQFIVPFEHGQTIEFDDFTLETLTSRHLYGHLLDKEGHAARFPGELPCPCRGSVLEPLDDYGGMFNTDFIITTKNNLRIGTAGGPFADYVSNKYRRAGLNVLMRQCGYEMRIGDVKTVAQDLTDTGAELLLPMHHERVYGAMDTVAFSGEVNRELATRGYAGRMFVPERGRWYKLGVSVCANGE